MRVVGGVVSTVFALSFLFLMASPHTEAYALPFSALFSLSLVMYWAEQPGLIPGNAASRS